MFPWQADRKKVIQLIFKALRKKHEISQSELAYRSEVSQASISFIENLSRSKRQATRDELIKTLLGLNLSKPGLTINAVLWLFEEKFLDQDERNKFRLKPAEGKNTSEFKVRKTILKLFEDIARVYKFTPAKSITKISENENDELNIQNDFLKIEQEEGIRLLMKKTPSSLTFPEDIFELPKAIPPLIKSSNAKKSYLEIRRKRILNFLDNIDKFGERCIHVKSFIQDYVTGKQKEGELTVAERKRHIKNTIQLLKNHKDTFQIRLLEKLPLFEYGIKSLEKVIVTAQFDSPETSLVRYIQLSGESSVIPYLLDFERLWDSVSDDQRDNQDVIEILTEVLSQDS